MARFCLLTYCENNYDVSHSHYPPDLSPCDFIFFQDFRFFFFWKDTLIWCSLDTTTLLFTVSLDITTLQCLATFLYYSFSRHHYITFSLDITTLQFLSTSLHYSLSRHHYITVSLDITALQFLSTLLHYSFSRHHYFTVYLDITTLQFIATSLHYSFF